MRTWSKRNSKIVSIRNAVSGFRRLGTKRAEAARDGKKDAGDSIGVFHMKFNWELVSLKW
jgi:hypothetical protein